MIMHTHNEQRALEPSHVRCPLNSEQKWRSLPLTIINYREVTNECKYI